MFVSRPCRFSFSTALYKWSVLSGVLFCLIFFTQHNYFGDSFMLCTSINHSFLSFLFPFFLIFPWVVVYWKDVPRFAFPFICGWAFGLFPLVDHRELRRCGHYRERLCGDTFFPPSCNQMSGAHGRYTFNFLRGFKLFSLRDCTTLHPHQLCIRVPVPLLSRQHLPWSVFFIISILKYV